ncbi:MAG: YihY/virulence factor BrkB family protein [Bacteroidetes bacterium]|uniref:YihY/virulence factor BrkB family protein n=1 Tax=Candidatus Cryptobacteroides merdigallinarum TaxID=2840770 RepID=A0A9D9EHV3_9BACT|nr:YihY/virulence factor BrkB family protein [Candidatus Cryptobacteroides merdigallinarum]
MRMKNPVNIFRRLKRFISEDIWNLDIGEFSRAKARFIKYLKVLIITIKTFSAEKIGFQAVALSFFGTMSVVPFLAVVFAITDGLGLADKLETLLYSYFSNSQETINMVLGFANNIIDTAQSSAMGLVSALLFVWLVFWMMISVERVFNNVWRVRKSRNIFKRVSFYIAILLIAPFVIMLFFSGSIVYSNLLKGVGLDIDYFESIASVLAWILFYIVAALTFSAMYKFIPNHKVLYSNALRASAISALAFTVLQYLYLETQLFVTRLNMVYGAVAAIPLFMFWMNFGWFIILFGAELSYAYQNVDNYNIE